MKIIVCKLSSRIFIIIVLLILIPFTLMLQYVRIEMEATLREEISLKITQNLSKSENEISQIFNKMISFSNMFYRDPEIAGVLSNDANSYYERMVAFNSKLDQISMQNLYDNSLDYMKVTLFDTKKQAYANWSLNYNDFTYILDQEWVQKSTEAKGHIIWNMSTKGYGENIEFESTRQISLARSIINDNHINNILGTVIISIDQQKISDILDTYKYSELDSIFASTQEEEVLFYNNDTLSEEQLSKLVKGQSDKQNGDTLITLNNKRYLLSFYTIKLTNMFSQNQIKIYYLTDYQKLDSHINSLMIKINIMSIMFIAVVLLVAFLIAKWIARPIKVLSNQMKNYRVGEAPLALKKERKDEIGEINSIYYNMAIHINDLFAKLQQEQVTKEKYKYESLRSKMSPHFLFNTLNSVRWMAIIRKADNIKESIDSLAEILQYSLTHGDEMVDLAKELEVVRSYCYIQNMRFGNSYSLKVNLSPDIERCQIIKFILQPVVENIFKHAFPSDSSGGVITISGGIEDDNLAIVISDDGRGFSAASIAAFNEKRADKALGRENSGIGLSIIDERIKISFGETFGISLSNNTQGGARVDYRLPVIYPKTGKGEISE